jgi:hypothetical protein
VQGFFDKRIVPIFAHPFVSIFIFSLAKIDRKGYERICYIVKFYGVSSIIHLVNHNIPPETGYLLFLYSLGRHCKR